MGEEKQRFEKLHNKFSKTSFGWETIKNGIP